VVQQEGEPSSTRGTHHYLTIHAVKESGKYNCKVFTMKGPVDQKSHHVTVENGMMVRISFKMT